MEVGRMWSAKVKWSNSRGSQSVRKRLPGVLLPGARLARSWHRAILPPPVCNLSATRLPVLPTRSPSLTLCALRGLPGVENHRLPPRAAGVPTGRHRGRAVGALFFKTQITGKTFRYTQQVSPLHLTHAPLGCHLSLGQMWSDSFPTPVQTSGRQVAHELNVTDVMNMSGCRSRWRLPRL